MVKEQLREPDTMCKVSHIEFGVMNAQQIRSYAHLKVLHPHVYSDDTTQRIPATSGVLDTRMGVSREKLPCGTCGKEVYQCVGHFGYMDNAMPVHHRGYFDYVINILQCICKTCSHVLLTEDEKLHYTGRCSNPDVSFITKKKLRTEIIDKCKKVKNCYSCGSINGVVRKAGMFKIAHDKFRHVALGSSPVKEELNTFKNAVANNKDLDLMAYNALTHLLNPQEVLYIFKQIPHSDISLLLMNPRCAKPEDLVVTRMLIPPVCIRPSVVSEIKSGTNEDDITMKLKEILHVNHCFHIHSGQGAKIQMLYDDWDFLQWSCNAVINGDVRGVPSKFLDSVKPMRGFVQRLKGKKGRFRGNLSGKRVNFSGRTVISPDPNLQVYEVGIPRLMAMNLTYPEAVTKHNFEAMKRLVGNGSNKYPGANYVTTWEDGQPCEKWLGQERFARNAQRTLKIGDIVQRHLLDGDKVLFNRQPSLHKLSIMCHVAKILEGRTLRFNQCCCNPYNADFDGDEMNLHVPQTEEARAEAFILLGNKSNLVTPRNGELLIAAIQDFITGSYMLTRKDVFLTRRQACNMITYLLAGDDVKMKLRLPVPAIMKPVELWSGKQIFGVILCPNDNGSKLNLRTKCKGYNGTAEELVSNDSFAYIRNSEVLCGTMDKMLLGSGSKANILYTLLRDFGENAAVKVMWRVGRVVSYYLMNSGFSIGINDVTPGARLLERKHKLLQTGYSKCDELIKELEKGTLNTQPGCTQEETLEARILKELSLIRDQAGKVCFDELDRTNSPRAMADCGSKGSLINISQMIACVGQQAIGGKRVPDGFQDRGLPYFDRKSKIPAAKGFVENSFYSGLTPTEFYFHTMGGREGLVDTAVKTAETGYMQRRLMKNLEDFFVHYDGTVRNSKGDVIQFEYGADGLDPTNIEGKDKPVDFQRVLDHVKASLPCADEDPLDETSIKYLLDGELNKDLEACSESFKEDFKKFMCDYAAKVGKTCVSKKLSVDKLVDFAMKCKEQQATSQSDFQRIFNDMPDEPHDDTQLDENSVHIAVENLDEGLIDCKVAFKNFIVSYLKIQQKVHIHWERLTISQLGHFAQLCKEKFTKAKVEPGTAVGALCAQSIGEPGTQMTLKTFHFAGVASMNITLGVPRIQEIINATKKISTPIITAYLQNDCDPEFARAVKGRIEKTTLGEICNVIEEVCCEDGAFVLVKLNQQRIRLLQLNVTTNTIINSIINRKKTRNSVKISDKDITAKSDSVIEIRPPSDARYDAKTHRSLYFTLRYIKEEIENVVIQGVPNVNRAVIHVDDAQGPPKYMLYVEGDNLRDVIATYGVKGTSTTSNNIMDVYNTLGIEAARLTIMKEIQYTMENHGMSIDPRHLMLVADLMTCRGEVLGITRFGLAKMKESILMLASFEKTADHLFDAAYYGQKDTVSGVSECIIMGIPMGIGTGLFKLLYKTEKTDPLPRSTIFDCPEYHIPI